MTHPDQCCLMKGDFSVEVLGYCTRHGPLTMGCTSVMYLTRVVVTSRGVPV